MRQNHFVTIESLSEIPEGLSVKVHDGDALLLRRDNEWFSGIAEQLEVALALSNRRPWPIWVSFTTDGIINTVRSATRTRLLGIVEETDGNCTVGLAYISTLKQLLRDNPEFDRLKETLLQVASERGELFYTEAVGNECVLQDVAPAA